MGVNFYMYCFGRISYFIPSWILSDKATTDSSTDTKRCSNCKQNGIENKNNWNIMQHLIFIIFSTNEELIIATYPHASLWNLDIRYLPFHSLLYYIPSQSSSTSVLTIAILKLSNQKEKGCIATITIVFKTWVETNTRLKLNTTKYVKTLLW